MLKLKQIVKIVNPKLAHVNLIEKKEVPSLIMDRIFPCHKMCNRPA